MAKPTGETSATDRPKTASLVRSSICALAATGIAIGWMVGLSASPVIQALITGILALICGVVTALVGLPSKSQTGSDTATVMESTRKEAGHRQDVVSAPIRPVDLRSINPMPMGVFVFSLAFGSTAGLYVRTHGCFEADPGSFVARWRQSGLDEKVLATRLLDQLYPPTAASVDAHDPKSDAAGPKKLLSDNDRTARPAGVLYGSDILKFCDEVRAAPDELGLREAMKSAQSEQIQAFESRCKDYEALRAAMETLICGDTRKPRLLPP